MNSAVAAAVNIASISVAQAQSTTEIEVVDHESPAAGELVSICGQPLVVARASRPPAGNALVIVDSDLLDIDDPGDVALEPR